METININIANDYSKAPGPRYETEGKASGEIFRKTILAPALRKAIDNDFLIELNLDGTAGYGTSFIEETFGGLIRDDKFTYKDVKKHIKIISKEEEYLLDDIESDLIEARDMSES